MDWKWHNEATCELCEQENVSAEHEKRWCWNFHQCTFITSIRFLTPKCPISLKWLSFVSDGYTNTFSKKCVAWVFLRAFIWSADWALPPGFEWCFDQISACISLQLVNPTRLESGVHQQRQWGLQVGYEEWTLEPRLWADLRLQATGSTWLPFVQLLPVFISSSHSQFGKL